MTVRIFDFHGKTVATSRNLRGVLDFARKYPVDVVTVKPDYTASLPRYVVTFYFTGHHASAGHCSCEVQWNDVPVLRDWLRSRRSWSVERVTFHGQGMWDQYAAIFRDALPGTAVTWR